jgi:hypothetical protein
MRIRLRVSCNRQKTRRLEEATDKPDFGVILSEAKNLSSISIHREILRFAQNDKTYFFHRLEACATWFSLRRSRAREP